MSEKGRENPLHLIHRWSIEHPYTVVSFFLAVVAFAIYATVNIVPRRFAPYVQSPMLGVVTMMPGLSAQEMELYISKPVEEGLANVRNLHAIRSNSQEGLSVVTLEFPYGTDMTRAQNDVQALMGFVQSQLPNTGANLKPSFVIPIDPLNLPILSLSLTANGANGWSSARLREFADNEVVNRLKATPGVYAVVPFGGFRRQVQVLADRTKLASYGLSILDLRDAIDQANVSQPAGTLTDGPTESTVRIDTRVRSAADVLNYPVKTLPGVEGRSSRVVYVRDVARVRDGVWEKRSGYEYFDHQPGTEGKTESSIEVLVVQNPGASSAEIVPAVMKTIGDIERENPGLSFHVAYDNAHFVNVLFDNVWHELAVAILLTSIAVMLFLGEWRGTLIALVTVPTSLAVAIALMVPFGMTFNSGTLIGLLLAIGRLVDDSVIDLHAVERRLRLGKSPKEATIEGIAEVRVAVVASTLMIVAALAPLLFCGGLVGEMFVELVWPLLFGLIASMLVSFTLTAVLCAALLRPESEREKDRQKVGLRWLYRIVDPVQRGLDRLEASYRRAIEWALRRRMVNLSRVAATVILGFSLYYFIGSEMMPLADTGQANGFLEMAPGTSYTETERAVHSLEKIMLRYPELEKASIEIGSESMFESWNPTFTGYQMPQVNGAAMMLTFSDKDERRRTIWQVIDSIYRDAFQEIPGLRRLQIKEMGSDVMATAQAPIQVNVYGQDLAQIDAIGSQMLSVAKKMKGELFQPAETWTMGLPEYRVTVNLQRAQELGLSPAKIAEQAYYATRGGLTNEFFRQPNIRQDTILVRYEGDQHRNPDDLLNVSISAPDGKQVPLSSLASIVQTSAPTAIEHDNMRRVVGIDGFYRLGGLPSMDVAMDLIDNTYAGNGKIGAEPVNFPNGYGLQVRGDMTQMMDSMRRLIVSLGFSLVLMYFILVVQFKGFLAPLQMLASLPLELAGVFAALFLAHQAFSTVSVLGIIVLTGMDITTAVLMIDAIMRRRNEGMSRDRAILTAGPERLRPILMTSGITMLVMLPVAIAPKTGLDAYQPLATAVVGGLLVGTVLSLFDIPIMHTVVDDLTALVKKPGPEPAVSETTV
jgi:HAE1 family hydrophobic/amphiphilic exporter-1